MVSVRARGARLWRQARWLAVFAAAWFGAGIGRADSPWDVVRIEEDWELVIATPDPNSDGPQVNCVAAPVAGDDTLYATFELNHHTLPEFAKGGVQLEVWSGDYNLEYGSGPDSEVLSTAGETIRWTSSMELTGGNIVFQVENGESQTWGGFGGQGYLKSTQPTDLQTLNGYSPDDSVANSGVGYAANRVQSLVLKRVRYITATGVVWEDGQPRVVLQKLD